MSSMDTVARASAEMTADAPGAVGPEYVALARAMFVAEASVAPSRVEAPVLLLRFAPWLPEAGSGAGMGNGAFARSGMPAAYGRLTTAPGARFPRVHWSRV